MAERNSLNDNVDSSPRPAEFDADVAAAERLDQIRQYLLDRRARLDIVATTRTRSGEEVDWIPVESQTADGRVADSPEVAEPYEPSRDPERPTEPARFDLEYDDAELGPPGSVPVRRHPVDRLEPEGDLRDFLAKGAHAQRLRPPDTFFAAGSKSIPDHAHAALFELTTCFGTEGTINVWRPYVEWSDEFSLGQLWLTAGIVGTVTLQSVEAGVQTRKDSYGDLDPHAFIYYTTNGYFQDGNSLGGYDRDVDGWFQTSRTRYPGGRVSQVSTFGGTQLEFEFKVQLFQDNWWIRVNGDYMGYYPASLYSPFGLRSQATTVGWGGEVFDELAHPGTTNTDMGSGKFPFEGFGQAAYMRNLAYQSDAAGTMTQMGGLPTVENPDCYDISANTDPNWGRYFYWGGTGRNSACP